MLVLTRRSQERIQIGDSITLTVVKVKGNTVRLGLEAPRNVRVVRGERLRLLHEQVDSVVERHRRPVDLDRRRIGADDVIGGRCRRDQW